MALRSLLTRRSSVYALISTVPFRCLSTAALLRLPSSMISPLGIPRRFLSVSSTIDDTYNGSSRTWKERAESQKLDPEALLPGCDFKHWIVFVDPPPENTPRDEIINSYIKLLTEAVGSEEEAKKSMYSVSTKYYYAFGAIISPEIQNILRRLPGVQWVLPDSYIDPKTKDYGGEPFINGKALPYDPKYHKVWLQNRQRQDAESRVPFKRQKGSNQNYGYSNQNREFQRPGPPMPPNQDHGFRNQNHGFSNQDHGFRNQNHGSPNHELRRPGPPMPNQNHEIQNPPGPQTPN